MAWMPKSTPKTEHEYVGERLSAYIDGELPPEEQGVVERHLASCQDCQWNLATLRQTVQWTRELPTVPVPHVFTIPVAARLDRARRWRWSLPVLQGATASVALLLVFVVAGDFLLTGMLPAVVPPMGGAVMEQPAADVQLTAAIVAEAVLETPAVEEPRAEDKAMPPPSAAPTVAAQKALPAAEKMVEEAQVAVTPTLENAALGAAGFEPSPEGEKEAAEAPRAPAPQVAATEALPATSMVGPAPTLLPTVAPTIAPTVAPTVVALAPEVAEAPTERKEAVSNWQREPPSTWLGTAEIVLAVAFVLLASATVALMVRRRRAR